MTKRLVFKANQTYIGDRNHAATLQQAFSSKMDPGQASGFVKVMAGAEG